MSAADIRIAAARGEAVAARGRLLDTVEEIKVRLAPRTIAHDAWEGAKDKSSEVAETAVFAVKERPAIAAGIAAGAVLLLARKPIFGFVADLVRDRQQPAGAGQSSSKE